MFPANYGDKGAQHVAQHAAGSQTMIEQYLDFAVDRAFRQTLFVRAGRTPRYDLESRSFDGMHFATALPEADGSPTRLDQSTQNYQLSSGATVAINDPALKLTCELLTARWPWTLSRDELIGDAVTRLGISGDEAGSRIDQLLVFLIVNGQARFRVDAVAAPTRVNEALRRIAAFTLTRGGDAYTFNVWHETVGLGSLDAHGLILADGTRNSAELVEGLLRSAREGRLQIELDDGQLLTDETILRDVFTQYVQVLPERLAEMKLAAAVSSELKGGS